MSAQAKNPNANCQCPAAGYCARHGVEKSKLDWMFCSGTGVTREQCESNFLAWEAGKQLGQTAPVAEMLPAALPEARPEAPGLATRRRGLGDWVADGIKAATFGMVKPCGGCKSRQSWLNHWFPADLPPIEPVTLDHPVRHLMFHVWPVAGFGAWQWNCDKLLANAHLFNGKRIVAIAWGPETDPPDRVKDYLKDFNAEFIVMPNSPQLREVVTFLPMLEKLEKYQSPQDVTFTCHGKCVRHKVALEDPASTIFRWTQAMYETTLDWGAVRPLLETHGTVGSFRRNMTPQQNGWGPWHFSGTFYWFRNRDVFRRNWRYLPQRFYGTEAWPGLMFKPEESGCIVGDDIGDLYKLDYWNKTIEPQLAKWRRHEA